MRDSEILRREMTVAKPKTVIREDIRMPDGVEIDWYFMDTPAFGTVFIAATISPPGIEPPLELR